MTQHGMLLDVIKCSAKGKKARTRYNTNLSLIRLAVHKIVHFKDKRQVVYTSLLLKFLPPAHVTLADFSYPV